MSDTDDLQELGEIETMLMAALAGVRKLFNRHAGSTMRLIYVAGDAQTGAAGTTLPVAFRVKVTLADGTTPVAGEQVTFRDDSDGSFSTLSVTSDASGLAESSWVLSGNVGAQVGVAEHIRSGQTVSIGATVTVGAAAQLIPLTSVTQASTTSAPVTAPPSAVLADSFGNHLGAGLSVSTAITGGGSRSPTSLTTDANGVVTMTSWTMSAVEGVHTLTLSYPGVSDLVFSADAVSSSLPVDIELFSGGTQSGGVVGLSTTPYIWRVIDGLGAGVPDITVRFTADFGGAPVDAVTDALGKVSASYTYGTLAAQLNTFSAAFTDDSSVEHVASDTATPVAGAVAALRYTQQPPSNMNSGDTMAPQPGVELIDSYGNRKLSGTGATAVVSLSIVTGSDASLGGTVSGAATAGLKTFTNVSLIDATGGASTLRASATVGSAFTIDSNTISAAPPVPHHSVISTQPSNTTLGAPFTFVVDVVDSVGVRIPGDTSTITVSFAPGTNTEGATLLNNGTTTLTAVCVGGRATFSLSVTVQTGSFAILAERGTDNAFDVTSNAFTISAADALYPNLPLGWGAAKIWETDCSGQPTSTWAAISGGTGYWNKGTNAPSPQTDASGGPQSAPTSLRTRYGINQPVGSAPCRMNLGAGSNHSNLPQYSKMYFSWWLNINPITAQAYENQATGTKLLGYIAYGRPQTSPRNDGYWIMRGTGTNGAKQANMKLDFVLQGAHGGSISNINLPQNLGAGNQLQVGQWHHIEVVVEMNSSADEPDGVYDLWIDGFHLAHYANVPWRTANSVNGFSGNATNFYQWSYDPVFGGIATFQRTQADDIYIDHVTAYGLV